MSVFKFSRCIWLFGFTLLLHGATQAQSDYGLCSQVFAMHQYCTRGQVGSATPSPIVVEGRVGKAGPRGSRGPPGIVDYQTINETLKNMFEGHRHQVEEKLLAYEMKLDKTSEALFGAEKKTTDRPTDCRNVSRQNAKIRQSMGGVFDIYPESNDVSYEVYCDLHRDGGGWTVFQRRMDGSVDFYRSWNEYVAGFGYKDKEMWLGLETIHQLTKNGEYELRIDMSDWQGKILYAKYGQFAVGSSDTYYTLTATGYSGNAGGDALQAQHNGKRFSTYDSGSTGCVSEYRGGWWYGGCHHANLNGIYYKGSDYTSEQVDGVNWWHMKKTHRNSLKTVEMKFRRKN